MKKEMNKFGLVLALFSFALLILVSSSLSLVSALTISTTDYSPTVTGVKISDSVNLYSYEINFVVVSGTPSLTFADALAKDGATTTNGYELKEINGANILAVYESILDPESPGVNLSDDYVFNITHSGTITLRQIIDVNGQQSEDTDNLCTETLTCGDWSTCVGGVQSRTCQSLTCHYDNTTENQACSATVTNPSGGAGGGSSTTQNIKIEFGVPNIQESGYVEVPVTIRNAGTIPFNDITLTSYLMKNGQAINGTTKLTKTNIASLSAGAKEDLTVSANIKENDVNFYELVVKFDAKSPVYSDSNKVLFTFVGKEGGKVLKVVAFTSGLIDEHPECLELKDMILEAQSEFNKGNIQLALQMANQAVDACKNYLESPLKPVISQKQYDKIPLYLGIGITAAILLGIIFNIYRTYYFRRR